MAGWGEFYASVNKPRWAPPAWLFGPVWAVLYALYAVLGGFLLASRDPVLLGLYFGGLGLNLLWLALWSRSVSWGSALHIAALFAVTLLLLCYCAQRGFLGLGLGCLLPYLAWLLVAGALASCLWALNRTPP